MVNTILRRRRANAKNGNGVGSWKEDLNRRSAQGEIWNQRLCPGTMFAERRVPEPALKAFPRKSEH
jgi:hypothetical protein